jgi:hypothetical protein
MLIKGLAFCVSIQKIPGLITAVVTNNKGKVVPMLK